VQEKYDKVPEKVFSGENATETTNHKRVRANQGRRVFCGK